MLSPGFSEFAVRNLTEIIEADGPLRKKFLNTYSLLRDILSELTGGSGQYFSGPFARMAYVLESDRIDEELKHLLRKFRYLASRARKRDFPVGDRYYETGIYSVARLIEIFSGSCSWPADVNSYLKSIKPRKLSSYIIAAGSKPAELKRAVVRSKALAESARHPFTLECIDENGEELSIALDDNWKSSWEILWPGAVINCHGLSDRKDGFYISNTNTIVVLEPDLLIDVTDIAECFQSRGTNILSYFLNRYVRYSMSLPMSLGNIVNACFDELLADPGLDFDLAMDKAMMSAHFQLFLLALVSPNNINIIREKTGPQFFNLKNVIKLLGKGAYSTEPSFISPDYGLQGRLDLLIEYQDKNQKDIIELKSGRAPSVDYYMKTGDGAQVSAGMWPNHLAQVTCYNMLLDSSFPGRSGVSAILYSTDINNPLRNAPNVMRQKQEIAKVRNQLIGYDHQMLEGNFQILDKLSIDNSELFPSFAIDDLKKFSSALAGARPEVGTYFRFFTRFILKEMMAARLGAGYGRSGYSALWRDSIEEKINAYSILPDMEIDYDASDFDKFYIRLRRPVAHSELICNLRRGDLVVLLPQDSDGNVKALGHQIIKGTLKEIDDESVTVTLRNKEFNREIFDAAARWSVEPDYVDSSNRHMFASLYRMLICSSRRQDLILGRVRPEFDPVENINIEELNHGQRDILQRAMAAREYFLLQGPPGTGKTSYMLKNLVQHIHTKSKGNILLLAYTNRAVDEICSALLKISADFPFLRTGSKESSVHRDRLISAMSESHSMRELYIKFKATRVFVSTVSFALSHMEFLDVVGFDTVIIDEASQILEPQLAGILASVRRFILIGDERQLPSIALHRENHEPVTDDDVCGLGIRTAADSLFGRLLRQCQENGWTEAYGMLDSQARMHRDISSFPNLKFYGGKLKEFYSDGWQTGRIERFSAGARDRAEALLSSGRMIFIESEPELSTKVHRAEADRIIRLVRTIRIGYGAEFNERTVGIISPFRAQCAEILKGLRQEGLDNMVMVDTVERFQGSERDIIIFSTAVSYEYQLRQISIDTEIEGALVDRKLNVAMTRAREHFIAMGCPAILGKSSVYKELLNFISENGVYLNKDEALLVFSK